MKLIRLLTLIVSFAFSCVLIGQSTSASLTGVVDDPSKAAIPGVSITAINTETGVRSATTTNGGGQYVLPGLIPGSYRVEVDKEGFKGIIEAGLILHVQDVVQINFHMAVGAMSETVSVSGDSVNVNTTDGSVSTVIDRQFVENLPLNGRSFQSLLYLSPGVAPNVSSSNNYYSQGQFVVNGQRGDASYWMVDGVGANLGMSLQTPGAGLSGGVGTTNALGGTSPLVSVDALREFRIETSSFAPEFGRLPGGQISIQTRSGTNQFHGVLFDYLRNGDLDAADWFVDHNRLTKPLEIQNEFGGVLGGPILKDKTFFFFSWEGLRLRLPQTFLGTVPDLVTRTNAIPAMQPYMHAYPLPGSDAQEVPGNPGLVSYSTTFSNPATADAYGLRIDHQMLEKLHLFARYSHAPSSFVQRGANNTSANTFSTLKSITKTATMGATWAESNDLIDELRFNYSVSGGKVTFSSDDFGGGTPFPSSNPFASGLSYGDSELFTVPLVGSSMRQDQGQHGLDYLQQYNAVDTFSLHKQSHSLKFGVDYRRLSAAADNFQEQIIPLFDTVQDLAAGKSSLTFVYLEAPQTFLLNNLGLFAQDTWRVSSRLNLTYGLRWDVDFVPTNSRGLGVAGITGFSTTDLSNLALAPAGTPPYGTQYGNVTPRISGAYRTSTDADWGTVLRAGFGIVNGLASTEIYNANYNNAYYPLGAYNAFSQYTTPAGATVSYVPFPIPPSLAVLPVIQPPNISNGETLFGFDPHLNVPYALEWNVAVEQSLGKPQSLSVSYVGASDKRLLAEEVVTNPNPNYASADLIGNQGSSNYQALQAQFQRRLSNGLQALVSYTWSHSIDTGSYGAYQNGSFADINSNRGNSDFDVRHAFSAAVTYNVPALRNNVLTHAATGGWSLDDIVQIRSGSPVDIQDTNPNFGSISQQNASVLIRPDIVPGQPFYLTGTQYPGRKALNPAALTDPPVDPATGLPARQGDLSRNALRAFGVKQWDFAARRDFPIRDALKLQFRAELFNVLNHPNFGPYNNQFQGGNIYFGQATQMLNQYLGSGYAGVGAQNPLYTPGSPRSIELALKLVF